MQQLEIDKCKEFMKIHRLDQMLAGILSGGTSTFILHPLDLVKTQFQVHTTARSEIVSKPYLYTFRYLKNIYSKFGFRKGLYQGLSANLAGSTASWGLYFYFYDWTKTQFPINSQGTLSPHNYFLSSSLAAIITVLFTNPLWMIKTRLCMQKPGNQSNYNGLIDAFLKISRDEGIRGLYRGLIPGLFGVSHGAIQFMVYEQLKNNFHFQNNRNINITINTINKRSKPSTWEYLLMSSTSKTVAMLVTYPYQVVRSRLQVRAEEGKFSYSGLLDVIKRTAKQEGIWAFYRGIIPSAIRVLPGTCITFLVYERVSALFRQSF